MPVAFDVEAALELGRSQPRSAYALVGGDEFVVVEADVEPGRVGGDDAVAAAEQAPQRLAGGLGLDVPQRGVEGADGAEDRAGVAGLERLPQHPVVEGRDAARVLAVDRGEDRVELDVRPEADAGDALVGLDEDDRHLGTTPSAKTPLASPTDGPTPGPSFRVRYPVMRMSALRGTGGDAVGDLALEEQVDAPVPVPRRSGHPRRRWGCRPSTDRVAR